jgi:UDP-N-acetylglucosamine--N-acetylmuramyl-(pentapeptide) pyrophosphoryl-undecaprenol N-acetylglucosamine transferase
MNINVNDARIVIMAGGTGGHVFPALAVARYLRDQGVTVSWLGTRKGIEADVVPRANFEIDYISISGLRGKGILGWIFAPLRLIRSLLQSLQVIRLRKPDAVLGMGGFVTGPGGVASWLMRKPLLIHEQNAIAGLTNRILARFAKIVMQGFPNTFHQSNSLLTGNPVRQEIYSLPAPAERKTGNKERINVLVFGGSLGAQVLNETIPEALAQIGAAYRPVVRHQTGKRQLEATLANYHKANVEADITPFIDDMAEAYAWADVVICRAGALTIAELAAVGIASVLVPYPYAVDDHQTANAGFLADNGAAMLVPQPEFTVERVTNIFRIFHERPEVLKDMANAARALAKPQACQLVAQQCMQAMTGQYA